MVRSLDTRVVTIGAAFTLGVVMLLAGRTSAVVALAGEGAYGLLGPPHWQTLNLLLLLLLLGVYVLAFALKVRHAAADVGSSAWSQ